METIHTENTTGDVWIDEHTIARVKSQMQSESRWGGAENTEMQFIQEDALPTFQPVVP